MKNTIIKSQDGKLEVKYSEVQNSCMCVSLFALLQYLLLFDEDTIKKRTCYFLGYAVNEDISRKLPGYHFKVKQTVNKTFTPSRWMDKLSLRIFRNCKYPFIQNTKIYAQDLGFLSSLIGRQSYTMLADAPNFLTMNMQPDSAEYQRHLHRNNTLQGKLEKLLYGNVAVHTLGDNPQCVAFYLTEKNHSPVLDNKKVIINSFQELWQKSSDTKKQFIMDLFGVNTDDAQKLLGKNIMFLTQPLVQDNILQENEYLTLLQSIFNHYDRSKVIIKTHPRDAFPYRQYFPDIEVYDKKVNIQLLLLSGVRLQKAVTICSSSINAFPNEVEADWFGTGLHPNLRQFYGEEMKPFRPYHQMSL